MIYAASRSIFTESAASEDCATFPRASHEFENDLCVSRFWTLLVGGGLFLVTVVAITVLGGLEYLQALFASATRRRSTPKPQELDPIMRATGPGNSLGAPFRSSAEPFFNSKFKSKPRRPTSSSTAAARSTAPPSHR